MRHWMWRLAVFTVKASLILMFLPVIVGVLVVLWVAA